MAQPRVFISSTCYDLAEVRDTLVDFIVSFGFEPVLSERGDVFYHPEIHTHDSCLNEVGNCQLLILIIGGRFGGSYIADSSKSIVNAEYTAARDHKIPVFTFVKRNVYSDHFVYQKNKTSAALPEIVFPSIDNNKHAAKIFDFIDDVRQSAVNNGFFPFEFARDIASLLRKQWAGMFFEFLDKKSTTDQFVMATSLLKNISIAGDKVEELVKSLYRHIDASGAEAKIDIVEKRSTARRFFDGIANMLPDPPKDLVDKLLTTPKGQSWYDYVARATGGTVELREFAFRGEKEHEVRVIDWGSSGILVDCPKDEKDELNVSSKERQLQFEIVKTLKRKELEEILNDVESLKARSKRNGKRADSNG